MKKLPRAVSALLIFAAAFSSAQAAGVKWHPGHYVLLATGDTQAAHFRNIDEIGREPTIKGVEICVWWYEIERSKGVYDFSRIDAYIAKLKSLPTTKRLVMRVMDRRFGATSKTGIVPNYLLTDPIYHGGVVPMNNGTSGYVARLWEAPVMDRLIALYRALGSRYNSNATVEAFTTEETVLSLGPVSSWPKGYSSAALEAQYERFAKSARLTMPETSVFLYANFVGSDSLMAKLVQSLVEPNMGVGASNTIPGSLSSGQKVWTGVTGADYRGLLAIANSVEALELGGSHGTFTPKQLADFAYKTLGVNYLFWMRNSWNGGAAQKWSTGILPFLRTNPPTKTGCPSSYGICNTH